MDPSDPPETAEKRRHAHVHPTASGRSGALSAALGANTVLLAVQVVGALVFGSLALLADSAHQLSDVVGLVAALVAQRLSTRPASPTYTYGLARAEILGALSNSVLLLVTGGWIVFEAVRRLGDAPEVVGAGVVALAIAGLAVNGASSWWLHRVAGENLNMRGAMLHLLADAATSFAVLLAGLAVILWDARWVDPAVSVLIALVVMWGGWRLLARTANVLLEAAPIQTDTEAIVEAMVGHDLVTEVHHLHVWSLGSEQTALTAHVVAEPPTLHDAQTVADELREVLASRFGVEHATLELECHPCDPDELGAASDLSRS